MTAVAAEPPRSGHAARALGAALGAADAEAMLQQLRRGEAPADALHDALQLVLATGDAERLRGFSRELQKRLERPV